MAGKLLVTVLLVSSTLVLQLSNMGNVSPDRSMAYLILPPKHVSNNRFSSNKPRHLRFTKVHTNSRLHLKCSSTQHLLFITSLILILSGDVELNPGPPNDEIKCVCSSTEEASHMLACESCLCWCRSECVNISPSIADRHPFICPF